MLKPVYALLGEESFLQLQNLSQLLHAAKDSQRVDLDGERSDLKPADLVDELQSFAMFGGSRVVVLRGADEFIKKYREALENYLQKPSSTATLVMRVSSLPKTTRIYKLIEKIGEIRVCEAPKSNLPQWIMTHARQAHQVTVPPDAAALLAEQVGADLGRLDSELAKLAIIADGQKISADDVRKGVALQSEQEMADLKNAVASGDRVVAVRKWRQLLQTDSSAEFRAVTWLGMWLEDAQKALAMRRDRVPDSEIAKAVRIWKPELFRRFLERAIKLGESGVARALDQLVEVDARIKSGLGGAAANVEMFLLTV